MEKFVELDPRIRLQLLRESTIPLGLTKVESEVQNVILKTNSEIDS